MFSSEVDATCETEMCDREGLTLPNVVKMENLNTSETPIEGLSTSKQDGNANPVAETVNLGENKCTESVSPPVTGNGSGIDSSRHADVNMKGISLFVELTGDISQPSQQLESSNGNQDEIIAAYKQCGVNVGDLVWAMIKKQSWWPGIICEASSVQIRENGLLVKCFGNGNYIWCHPKDIKPFIKHFDQFSNKRNSKKFFEALENALLEVGQRVKSEFTCSCSSNLVTKRRSNVDDLSLSKFEPVKFLDFIEDLSRNGFTPNKIDFSINMNFLAAFNHSLGKCQIPLHQLKPIWDPKIKTEGENGIFEMEDDVEGSGGSSEKGYDTRERRKSRFLSMEELKEDEKVGMELNKTKESPIKKPRKKYSRKVVVKQEIIPVNICSSDVLFELQSAGQDCLFPSESTKFDSVLRFITGFRKWVFQDSIPRIQTPESENGIVIGIGKGSTPKKVKKKTNKSGSLVFNFQNGNSVVSEPHLVVNKQVQSNNTVLNFGNPQMTKPPLRKLLPKRRIIKMDNNTPIQGWNNNPIPTPMPNVNGHMDMNMKMNMNMDMDVNKNMNLDMNMNMNMGPFRFHPMEELNQGKYEFGSTRPWLINHGQPQLNMVNHEPKKRGRKRKHVDFQANEGLTKTPDLTENGGVIEKKRGKRGKKKEETGVPCIDLTYNKVNQETTEVKGTAFLLKFSSNYPLPSTQVLNLVFSKYGELNESETFISTENLSGQVVFSDSSSAGGAFWGLQNDQPFGPALVNYRIQHLNVTESLEFKTPIKTPEVKEVKGQEGNNVIGAYMIPDLNGYAHETKIKKMEEVQLPSMDLCNGKGTKVQNCNEVLGTVLILKFSPCQRLPSIQDLNLMFCKYGLNGSETRVMGQDLTGQVVFVNPLVVNEAVQDLEKERPFGDGLVSYRVQHNYNVKPAIPLKVAEKEGVDIGVIRKNLEMMKVMLEKGGDGLSREMRGKLESEIRGLMNKVGAMDGCSSSS